MINVEMKRDDNFDFCKTWRKYSKQKRNFCWSFQCFLN